MRKLTTAFILIALVIVLVSLAYLGGGAANAGLDAEATFSGQSHQIQATMAADATATYGAEQFHLQLTAMAEQDVQSTPVRSSAP